jgi:aminoglycoside phosphotransferase (APT) family kinase protein
MSATWPAEPEAVRRAIEGAFPGLRVGRCAPIGEGWDSAAWEVNGEVIFRFPKRAVVAGWLEREIALLPHLGPALPVPIPRFTYVARRGAPTDPAFPFVGYRKLEGVFLDRVPGFLGPASPLIPQLGAFLRALHAFPRERAIACGVPAMGWGEWVARWEGFAARVMTGESGRFDARTRARVAAFRDAFLVELRRAARPVALIHHDLALEHILADPTGARITGVIDWGDVAIGDPAIDFAGFARSCDSATVAALVAAYGPTDDGFLRRADWYARLAPFHLLYYGLEIGDEGIVREAAEQIAAL